MAKTVQSLLALALVAGLTACAAPAPEQEEITYIDVVPEPIQPEHTYTKYD